DSVSLFDHTSGASLAPPATADSATCSQWLTHDASARLAVRNHLLSAEYAHFGQHKTAKALYNDVVARYSSPATAALGRLLLPYLFPELSTFATVEDLITHLRISVARYRAALPAEFLHRNPPPMYITLYFIVTRFPDSLRAARDQFLALDPTALTVDLLEQHLLAAETSVVAVGAAHGTPRTPFFERCSPSPLAPSYASACAVDILGAADVGAASAISGKRGSSKGKGGRGGGGGSGGGSGGDSGGGGGSRGGGSGGSAGGSGGFGGGSGGDSGGGGSGNSGSGGSRSGAFQRGGSGGGQRQQQQRRSKTPSPQQLGEWFAQRGASGGSVSCPYVIRTEFGHDAEPPCWVEQLRSGVDIFALDYDAILAAMYALSVRAEGDCDLCVPPDPGIEATALGGSESALPGTTPAVALHTFTLDSGASRCLFRNSTALTPLPTPVPVRLADPSGDPVLAHSSTVLPCPAVPSGSLSGIHLPSISTNLVSTAALQDAMVTTTTPGGHCVWIYTCTRMCRHLATFTCRLGLSLYTLTAQTPQVAAFADVSVSGQVAPPCSCRLVSHQTLLWHHGLGHPSLPCLRGMHSRLLVSGLPRSLPPLLPSPAPPCLPSIKGRQRVAPQSSSFPPTTAPLHTLHMDVWGPARVSGQGCERYFLLVFDDYTRYTTVFPLRSKGEVPDVLIPWIRAVRVQLHERFREDLPVLRLHSDRGGEFSSDLLRDFFMEVARTSMIHAAAPHFLWSFAVRYAAHQLNLWPCVSLLETLPTLRWTGKVGNASVFRFYHPTSHCVLPSQDIMFDDSVPFYRLFPYLSAPPPPPPLFLAPDPLPGAVPVEVAIDSGATRGSASGSATSRGAELASAELGGAAPAGAERDGAAPEGAEPGGAEPEGAEFGGLVPEAAEPGGAEPRGTASFGGPAGASSRRSPRPEPLSPQQQRKWFAQRTRLSSEGAGAGDSAARGTGAGCAGATSLGGARVLAGAGGTGGAAAAGPGGARIGGSGTAGACGVGGTGAGGAGAEDPGTGGAGAGGTGACGIGAGEAGAGDPGAGGAGPGGTGVIVTIGLNVP
ncbi:unnamed protein product, partial [Closterium sp. NIES-53]